MAEQYSEGNLSVNIDGNQNRSALLGDQSPNRLQGGVSGLGGSQGNLDNMSQGGSQYAPPPKFYKSEGQSKLDYFQDRYKQEAGNDGNLRKSNAVQAADDSENSDADVADKQKNLDQTFTEKLGFKFNAPLDAAGCSTIQSMQDYVKEVSAEQKNPKQQFFDLSRSYYTAKYDKDNKKEITVKSYIITEDHQNFIKDLSMDILQTNQGCMPIIKTFEWNAYSKHKFVKALKFYNYRTDCKLSKQFVVDDGVMHDNFNNYDVSLLHFGNTILFYKREENWHKLMMYDVLTKQENELEGYQIVEPVGDDALRYHIMFSQEFGTQSKSKLQKQGVKSVHDFLKTKFVFAQTYRVQEQAEGGAGMRYNHYNTSLGMWSMEDTQNQLIQYQYVQKSGQENLTYKEFGFTMNQEAVQWVGHMHDPENKQIIFMAVDPFKTHKFEYRPYVRYNQSGSIEFTEIQSYLGNNELQNMNRELVTNEQGEIKRRMQNDIDEKQIQIQNHCSLFNLPMPSSKGNAPKDKKLEQMCIELNQAANMTEKQWKYKNLAPFLIHQNPQFLIQKESIEVDSGIEGKKTIDQYYYISHDNQFMLIYPNYNDQKEKTRVILEIAKKHRQHQMTDDDVDYDILNEDEKMKLYNDDFIRRQKEFRQATQKKISHVCNDPNRSMNHMKKSDHLKMILDYPRDLDLYDKIILSTDQEQSNIYVYQSSKITGENKIEIFSFANNIAQSRPQKTLQVQIQNIINDEDKVLNKKPSTKRFQADSRAYYLNSKYKNLISSNTHIKSTVDDAQDKADLIRPEFDDELKQEVLEYRSNQMTHRIAHSDEQRFAVVEGKNGKYFNIRIKMDHNNESITFQMYTRNNTHYCFCFTINVTEMKKTYFFVKKTIREVEELGNDNHQSLITFQEDQKITVVMCNDLIGTKKQILEKYTKQMTFKELQSRLNEPANQEVVDVVSSPKKIAPAKNEVNGPITPYQLHLQFETLYDMQSSIDFLPFIYQDREKIESHSLLVMDIDQMQVVQKTCINANLTLRKTIRKSETGFSIYTLTRTSDVYNQKQGFFTSTPKGSDPSHQIVKYQVSGQYFIGDPEEKNPAACTIEFSEYCVKFSNYEKNFIQLIGRKQLLLSDFAMKARTRTFDKFLIIPWFDSAGSIKGSQFLLKEDKQFITLKDQDENNIYHQKSQMCAFGHQKFLTNPDNHDEYILIAAAQFRQKVYMQGNFENNEAYYILNKIQKKLLSQQLAKFEYFVLNDDFDALMREEFYQPQEVLQGKTIFDLCLGFPKEIAHGLKHDKEVYKRIDGSLISEICNYDDKILQFYLDAKLCEENLMVQIDFNFVSSIRLAMELNSNQSVKLMLNNVFKLNSIEYQEMMMLDFPKFIQQNNIKRIFPFLERDYEEFVQTQKDQDEVYTVKNKKRNQFCNFEEFLSHPKLPPFGTDQKSFHVKEHFHDFHNSEHEIVQEMIEKDPYMTWGVKNFGNQPAAADKEVKSEVFQHKNVEVEHSLIDFQKIIIGEKIRDVQEDGFHGVNFNDQHLASIFFLEPDHQVEFYNLETVRKIIDFQFITTKWFVELMFKFYLFGFMIPYIISLTVSVDRTLILGLCFTLCLFTQIFFFMFELVQLKEQRLAYFTDFYNVIDTSQFAIFFILFIWKMSTNFQSDTIPEIFMQGVLLYQCFYKCFYFIRIYDSMAFILTLLVNIIYEALPFAGFILCILFGFVKIYSLFKMGYEGQETSSQDEADLSPVDQQIKSDLIKRSILVYMNIAGEISAPILETETYEQIKDNYLYMFLMFGSVIFFWISQQMLFGVAGTFFVGMVLQSYEKQYSKFPMYHYKIKARYNEENFQILDMFRAQRNFKVIFFSFDKDVKNAEESQWLGSTNAIQKFQINMMNKKREVDKQQNKKAEELAAQQKKQSQDVEDSLKLIRYLATENQELKARVATLSQNLGFPQN